MSKRVSRGGLFAAVVAVGLLTSALWAGAASADTKTVNVSVVAGPGSVSWGEGGEFTCSTGGAGTCSNQYEVTCDPEIPTSCDVFELSFTLQPEDGWGPGSWSGCTAGSAPDECSLLIRRVSPDTTNVTAAIVDATDPSVALTAPTPGLYRGTIHFAASASDGQTGVSRVEFLVGGIVVGTDTNGGDGWTLNWPSGANEGLQGIRARAYDGSGRTTLTPTTLIQVDNSAPTGSLSSPAAGAILSATFGMTASASDARSGVQSVGFDLLRPGNPTWHRMATDSFGDDGWADSWSPSVFGDQGVHQIRVVITDRAGNQFVSSGTSVTFDTVAPTGSITSPAAGASIGGIANVVSNSADSTSGVKTVTFYQRPTGTTTWSAIGAPDTTAPYSVPWDTSGLNGAFRLRVVTEDNAGLSTTSAAIGVNVDNLKPTGTVSINGGATYAKSTAATLTLSASDTGGAGVTHMRFRNGVSGMWSAWQAFATTMPWTLGTQNGTKKVFAQFRDAARNKSTESLDTIGLDTVAPGGSVSINDGDATTSSRSVTLTLTASDPFPASGVGFMRFRNSPSAPWSIWYPFATTKSRTLPADPGEKTVYAQFKDRAGNKSVVVSDTIEYIP